MRFGSLFSGLGGFDLALERAGMSCAWQCEIDKAARRVLRRHCPDVPLYADVRELRGNDVAPVELICGGFPCQDLSVAGKRAGLGGERSGLFWELVRIIDEARPRWILLENVPGLLSSHRGRDMGAVVGALCDLGYGLAWRVLDSRYFGVPQRRRRVFIVGRAGADWRRAGEVLFERPSRCGNPRPRQAPGESVAGTLGGGSDQRGWCGDLDRMTFIPEVAGTLAGGSGQRGWTANVEAMTFIPEVAHALTARGRKGGDPTTDTYIPFDPTQITSRENRCNPQDGDPCHPLVSAGHPPALAFTERTRHDGRNFETSDLAYALTNPGSGGRTHSRGIFDGWRVRRLTPTEGERLQAVPDGWTAYDHEGKPLSDSARYRLLGNAVTVSVVEWIARRLVAVEAER